MKLEEAKVTIRNWIRLFFNTLLIGGAVTAVCSLIFRWTSTFQPYVEDGKILSILSSILFFIFFGFTLSVLSQMGFFAYLTVHRIGLGMFRSFWNSVQIVLVLFTIFDIIYFRSYVLLAIGILIIGLIIAYFKNKQAKQSTYVSALFFMVVGTTIEWLPLANNSEYLYIILISFLVCNGYQLLILPKFIERSEEERKAKSNKKS